MMNDEQKYKSLMRGFYRSLLDQENVFLEESHNMVADVNALGLNNVCLVNDDDGTEATGNDVLGPLSEVIRFHEDRIAELQRRIDDLT